MVVTSQADATRAGARDARSRAATRSTPRSRRPSRSAVTQPFSTGLGGGAFVLICAGRRRGRRARRARDGAGRGDAATCTCEPGVPERASLARSARGRDAGLRGRPRAGARALRHALARRRAAPAIALAEQGFAIGPYHARMLEACARHGAARALRARPRASSSRRRARGAAPGWRLRAARPRARRCGGSRAQGPDAFYRGDVGRAIAEEVQAQGGLLTLGGPRRLRAEAARAAARPLPRLRGDLRSRRPRRAACR